MIKNVYEYQEGLKRQGIYFSSTGPVSHILMEGIADMLKQKMRLENIKTTTMMNVFSVVVEQAQNIIRHSAEIISGDMMGEDQPEIRIGTLVMGYEEGHYFLISGNMVGTSDVGPLRERLTTLRNMTKPEIKKAYKEQIRKDREIGKRGAGLGLMEMAKKASKPMEFDFQEMNESMSFFSLKVTI